MVVFGHSASNIKGDLNYHEFVRLIYSFHMEFFFFISGLFALLSIKKRKGRLFSNKVKTLLYPFLCGLF
ncbi:acyltransferase family protein [Anaerosinus sp.]|uniref:acyltransferase family protein n=1 Tax=Selenobaculum sp. TaxID=3074374 RepID=UPI003AB5E438